MPKVGSPGSQRGYSCDDTTWASITAKNLFYLVMSQVYVHLVTSCTSNRNFRLDQANFSSVEENKSRNGDFLPSTESHMNNVYFPVKVVVLLRRLVLSTLSVSNHYLLNRAHDPEQPPSEQSQAPDKEEQFSAWSFSNALRVAEPLWRAWKDNWHWRMAEDTEGTVLWKGGEWTALNRGAC